MRAYFRVVLLVWGILSCRVMAGEAVTRDGKTYWGVVKLAGEKMIVEGERGTATPIPLSNVVRADFSAPRRAEVNAAPASRPVLRSDRSGLCGEYFADRELKDLRFVRIDRAIDFHSHADNPIDPTSPPEGSVRWTGMIEPRHSEDYRFHVEVHRRVRLWVDGQLVIDQWKGEGGDFTSTKVNLTAGKRVSFKLEYTSPDGFILCRAKWSSPSTSRREVIPPEAFSLAEEQKLSRAVISLLSPAANAALAAPASVKLSAAAISPNGQIRKVEFFDRTTLVATAEGSRLNGNGTLFEATWEAPAPGVYQLWARVSDAAGVTALSEQQLLTVTGKGEGSLEPPWGDFFIANNQFKDPARAGARGDGEATTYTIDEALGTLIGEGEHDGGHFIVRPLVGDGQIVARVASLQPIDPDAMAMAGITLRENMKNRCRQFSVLHGIPVAEPVLSFVRRVEPWKNPVTTERQTVGPYWVKLVRHGDLVHASTSQDGKSWDLLSSEKFAGPAQAFVGLVAFSQDRGQPAKAVFDHVEVKAGSPALASGGAGFLTRGGTFVAAEVGKADDNFVYYKRDGKEGKVPAKDVSRVLFKPLLAEHAEKLADGRSGALMTNGDFFEGEVKELNGSHAAVTSVLFGVRRLSVQEELVAVVLHELSDAAVKWDVRTSDGSSYRVNSVREENGEVILEDGSLGKVSVPVKSVVEIRSREK